MRFAAGLAGVVRAAGTAGPFVLEDRASVLVVPADRPADFVPAAPVAGVLAVWVPVVQVAGVLAVWVPVAQVVVDRVAVAVAEVAVAAAEVAVAVAEAAAAAVEEVVAKAAA